MAANAEEERGRVLISFILDPEVRGPDELDEPTVEDLLAHFERRPQLRAELLRALKVLPLLERLRALLDRAQLQQDDDGRTYIEVPRVDALELADLQHRLDVACRSSR